MKYISFICLIVLGLTYQVNNNNKCMDCNQLKSQRDCEQQNRICEWIITSENTPGKCVQAIVKPIQNYTPYCELVDKPETNCAKTLGCAYIDSKCTHFTGCQAYVQTTTVDCQTISYFCVSDGNACIQAKECKEYSQQQCESTPSVSGVLKCKWETSTGICRDYFCSEADPSLNTDEKCSSWLIGCVTKGQGCVNSPRPVCATYTGDDSACQSFIGSDGNCELAAGTTNCKAKKCQNAPSSLATDDDCKAYLKGCITTGKGCVLATTKPLCSTYSGDNTTCVGYIGLDGVCEGDAGGSNCRARKCENGTFNTDELCKQYQSSCKTNGKICVSSLSACNTYKGTATSCAVYIGTDGYCNGTSTTNEASCLPKVCEEAPDTTTTNETCNKYQIGCVTTGKGCVTKNNLKSCTTYDGNTTSCQSRVGSEGQCTWKSGTKCVARDCTQAQSNLNTNTLCANYFFNCVTTGSGCVSQTTCDLTVKQQSCEGTNNCSWQSICTSNASCSEFKKKSICLANSARVRTLDKIDEKGNPIYIYLTKKCGWLNNACKEFSCSDLTGAFYNNDANCTAELSTCISNRVDACITKYECSKLTGTQSTCSNYPGYCSNTSTAIDTTPCIQRKCSENVEAIDNVACAIFLPGCISNRKGCVDYTTPCTSMNGTQETCNKIFAYKSGSIDNFTTSQCYNSASASENDYCLVKTCKLAKNQNDGTCGSFLEGCVYNGNGGCVDPKADDTTCASYTGTATFCESAIVGSNTTKYCFGTSTTTACTLRVCTDNKTATKDEDCEDFMSGCIAKSEGGCISQQSRSCSQQTGSVTTCPNFSGGLYVFSHIPLLTKVGCTKYDACQDRLCSDITNPASAQDCTNYKSTCRFFKTGAACIEQAACNSYTLPDTATTDQLKFQYCTNIKDYNGLLCGYTVGATQCSIRSCDQFLSTYTILSCTTYLQKNVSTNTDDTCKLAGTLCYLPRSDCAYYYTITDITDTLRLTQCQQFVNDKGLICTFQSGDTNCSLQDTCEKLINQTDERTCNDQTLFTSAGKCQKVTDSTCLTLSTNCTDYKIDQNLSFNKKQNLCWRLKVVDDLYQITSGSAMYRKCVYKTGSRCDAISACSDIYSASSQAECESYKSGCLYYRGKCYAEVLSDSCPTRFPIEIITDSQKSLYCRSIKEAFYYCSLATDKTKCELATNVDCAAITIPIAAGWDGQYDTTSDAFKTSYCLAQSYRDRTKFCKYTSAISPTVCSDATCADIPSPASQGDCDNYIYGCIYYNYKCYPPEIGVTADDDCTDNTKVPIDLSLTAAQKVAYCQSFSAFNKTIYCTYDQYSVQLQSQCTVGGSCDSYTSLPAFNDTDRQTYCLSKINKTGKRCAFTAADSKCRDFDCQDIQNPTSQIDCDLGAPGKPCIYLLGTCYNRDAVCTSITAQRGNEKVYCNQVTGVFTCTYISGTTCAIQQDCHLYSVTSNQATVCATLTDHFGNRCTYLGENNCVKLDVCNAYDGTTLVNLGPIAGQEDEQCKQVKSINNYPCIRDSVKKCRTQVCTDNDASATDCVNNADGCLYYFNKCIAKDICTNYTAQGDDDTAKQTWCEGVQNSSGDFCAWDPVNSKCRDRLCSDKKFYTDFDCQSYLKYCKTNGRICVSQYSPCSSNNGSSDFCQYLLDSTGKHRCRPTATASTSLSACINKTCYDNVTATTDSECDTYLSGCVTRGAGCIPNTESCTSYRGTKQQCELFKKYTGLDTDKNPIYEYCSGEVGNTATSKCKVRTCADNTTAITDAECATYLKSCITKGTGCIDATSSCTAFKGDQAICAKFMGNSNKVQCWNTLDASAQSDCVQKKCSDISGKNNKECNDGMLPLNTTDDPFCVFDGTSCIDYGKLCNAFNGTEETCTTFLAKDGPCKAITVGTAKGKCAKKVCTEAPNTLTTDADCQKYHKDCYTTGYGCTSVNQCNSIISRQLCQGKPECTWVKYCTDQITKCETYNNTSYSQCANSKLNGKFCFWNEHYSLCKSQTCENQPQTLDSHAQCQNFADNCTTTGAGCITISVCTAYMNQSICNAASSSRDGLKRCIWDSILNSCRNKMCSDISAQINAECEAFDLGCKLNGQKCVMGLSCTEFTNKLFCLKSKTGPCLWVNGECYNYKRCEDAVKKTHPECQAFSPLCTTNGDTCIPITTCQNTSLKVSCVIGTDGVCGWLPTGKCYKFGQCTDAIAATNDECLSYGPTCITDGTACIAKSTCSSYITQIACDNNGTDGICYWNATANTCKLKECSDEQKGTNNQCKLISVTGGSCTTDGTKCIPQSTCSSYTEAGCLNGTDGECIFSFPIGANSGTKICRLKQCQDISGGTSNTICMGAISGKSCVSNGTSCFQKIPCSLYRTITSCNGGGFENNKYTICAFTPGRINSFQGICKTFSACSDANQDQLACLSNPSCKWTENKAGFQCESHTCETYAIETECHPIPSFDGNYSTICLMQNGKCVPADPITITDPRLCYIKSAYTHSWNILTSKCESCIPIEKQTPDNPNDPSNPNIINSKFFLSLCLWGLLGSF